MFFGISFILNMLLRKTWLMSLVYPIIVLLIVGQRSFLKYFTDAKTAFPALLDNLVNLTLADIIILASGLVGTLVSGIVIRMLRKSGYQMF